MADVIKCSPPVVYPAITSRSLKLKSISNTEEFFCDACGATFRSKCGLVIHIKHCHPSDGQFSCDICPNKPVFSHSKSFKRHFDASHCLEKPFKCKDCPKSSKVRSRLDAHAITHSPTKTQACAQCGKLYKRARYLADHVQRVHHNAASRARRSCGKNFICDVCGAVFKKRISIERHIYLHYSDGEYLCEVCLKLFENSKLFEMHKLKCPHDPQGDRYRCEHCGRTFAVKSRLDSHIVVHSSERNFSCTECGLRFKRKRGLRVHIKGVHESKRTVSEPKVPLVVRRADRCSDGKFSCVLCSKIFEHSELFERHMSIFHDTTIPKPSNAPFIKEEKRYQCKHCDAAFTHKCKLRYHMVKHSNKKNFICAYCNDRFKCKHSLKNHFKTHKKKTVVACIISDEKFEQIIKQDVLTVNELKPPEAIISQIFFGTN